MDSQVAKGTCQCQAVSSAKKQNRIIWFFRCSNSNGTNDTVSFTGTIDQYPDEQTARVEAIRRCELWAPPTTHCLPADTLVTMFDGSQKEIASLVEGDEILGTLDGEKTFADKITDVQVSKHSVTIEVGLPEGGKLIASPSQPILSSKGPITVADLAIEDSVDLMSGLNVKQSVTVLGRDADIQFQTDLLPLYSLATEKSAYFFIGESKLVAKCKGPCGGGPTGPNGACL